MSIVASTESQQLGNSMQFEGAWTQVLLRTTRAGSAGVVVLVEGYGPYLPHVGTSPSVVDLRFMAQSALGTAADEVRTVLPNSDAQAVLALSVAEQAQEVLASLSLNKTQLAEVLRVTRPTLYEWLDGKVPKPTNAQRLTKLLRMLASAGVTSANPLSPRFLREPLREGGTPLLEALSAEAMDEQLVTSLVRAAKALDKRAEARRLSREERLRALGFEEPSTEQRREQLARIVAMRDWPK